jgi:transposase-like protein
VDFGDETIVVALGIDVSGRKHVLGLMAGTTENAVLVRSLLADLVSRGLDPAKRYLFVLDGAKALLKGQSHHSNRLAFETRSWALVHYSGMERVSSQSIFRYDR